MRGEGSQRASFLRGEGSIQDLRVIEAIHEAAERGCWVELEHEHEHEHENENVKVEQRAVTGDR